MHLSHLALSDFRNYEEAVIEFTPGVMVLVGRNGQGKTNLVEAIAYLSTFSSHRVSADAALVRAGAPGAVVRAKVVTGAGTVPAATGSAGPPHREGASDFREGAS
ncbi:MAG: AAA family ATPase, partial [bacterium]|nr:AAA family ATPase [bacterium]